MRSTKPPSASAMMRAFALDDKLWTPLTTKEFSGIKSALTGGDFTKLVSEDMAQLAEKRSGGRQLPVTALSKIRGELLVLRAMEASRQLPRCSAQVVHRYETAREDIYTIALSVNQPAMACFRAVLKSRGLSDAGVKAGTQGNTNVLATARDQEQQKLAAMHDHATTAHEDNSVQSSLLFEADVQAFLDHHKVEYETQSDLLKQPGNLTPDFLLKKPVRFGEHEIRWIDAKDFFGGVTPFMTKKTRAQANKYMDAFGPGAIVYSRGLTEAHRAELPCLTMDFRWLGFSPPAAAATGKPQQPPQKMLAAATAPPQEMTHKVAAAAAPPQETAQKKPRLASPAVAADKNTWDEVMTMLAAGHFTDKVDAQLAAQINAKLSASTPYAVDELNRIRYDVLRLRAVETALPRGAQRRLYDKWLLSTQINDAAAAEHTLLLDLSREFHCPPHVALQHVAEFHNMLGDKSNSQLHTVRLAAATAQIDKLDWLHTPPSPAKFLASVTDFLRTAGVAFTSHSNDGGGEAVEGALVVKPGCQLKIEDRAVRWLLCRDGLGGAGGPPAVKLLRKDVDKMRKAFGGQGAVVFSLGVLPDFGLFGNTAELVVDFRDLAEEEDDAAEKRVQVTPDTRPPLFSSAASAAAPASSGGKKKHRKQQ